MLSCGNMSNDHDNGLSLFLGAIMASANHKKLFGKNLARILRIRDISQAEFAQMLGVHPAQVNKWCKGVYTPSDKYVGKILKILDAKIGDMYVDPKNPSDLFSDLTVDELIIAVAKKRGLM